MTAPVMDRPEGPPAASANIPDPGRGRRGLAALTGNWSDLRSTPYGTRPVSAMVFRSLVTGVTASAAGLATPFIIQDLKIDIRTIINISATVGFFLTFVAIAVGWWADRHPRIPLLAWGGAISGLFSMLTSGRTWCGAPWSVTRSRSCATWPRSASP